MNPIYEEAGAGNRRKMYAIFHLATILMLGVIAWWLYAGNTKLKNEYAAASRKDDMERHSEIALLRKQEAGSGKLPEVVAKNNSYKSLNQFENKGRATPEAAFETGIWAMANRNKNELSGMFHITKTALKKVHLIEKYLPDGPDAASPEELAALAFSHSFLTQTKSLRLESIKYESDDRAVLMAMRPDLRGGDPVPIIIRLLRTPDGWKFPIPSKAMEDMPGYLDILATSARPPPEPGEENEQGQE